MVTKVIRQLETLSGRDLSRNWSLKTYQTMFAIVI